MRAVAWPSTRIGTAAICAALATVLLVTILDLVGLVVSENGRVVDPIGGLLSWLWQPAAYGVVVGVGVALPGRILERPLGAWAEVALWIGTALVGIVATFYIEYTAWWSRVPLRIGVDLATCLGVAVGGVHIALASSRIVRIRGGLVACVMVLQGLSFSNLSMLLHEWRNRGQHVALLRTIADNPRIEAGAEGRHEGAYWILESRDPILIAWEAPGRLLDNWIGVVYDESGTMGEWTPSRRILGKFGGTVIHVMHTGDYWYVCVFT